ncbi:MAG: hypothetical protein AAF620_15315 [Bacteroidota bacterium]
MSWIIVDKKTKVAIVELFTENLIYKINTDKYEVLTAFDYLVSLNDKNKNESLTQQ